MASCWHRVHSHDMSWLHAAGADMLSLPYSASSCEIPQLGPSPVDGHSVLARCVGSFQSLYLHEQCCWGHAYTSVGIFPGVEWLHLRLCDFSTPRWYTVFQMGLTNIQPLHHLCVGIPHDSHLCQHLVSPYFFIFAYILMCYVIMAFIGIS